MDFTDHTDQNEAARRLTGSRLANAKQKKGVNAWMNQRLLQEITGIAWTGHGSNMNAAAIMIVGISAATKSPPGEMPCFPKTGARID
jgi:hypothetical protein